MNSKAWSYAHDFVKELKINSLLLLKPEDEDDEEDDEDDDCVLINYPIESSSTRQKSERDDNGTGSLSSFTEKVSVHVYKFMDFVDAQMETLMSPYDMEHQFEETDISDNCHQTADDRVKIQPGVFDHVVRELGTNQKEPSVCLANNRSLLPWQFTDKAGLVINDDDLKAEILSISLNDETFMAFPSEGAAHLMIDDVEQYQTIIEKLLQEDENLTVAHHRLVGQKISEYVFWKNYLSKCETIKQGRNRKLPVTLSIEDLVVVGDNLSDVHDMATKISKLR